MTLIRRPSPLADLVSFRDTVERLFDERLFRPVWLANGERQVVPAVDLYTTPEAVIAKVALPGVNPEDVDGSVGDDLVTITGSFKEEKETAEAGYVHKELSHGSFSRSFSLPTAVKAEDATASFKDGLLTLTSPNRKRSSQSTSRWRSPDQAPARGRTEGRSTRGGGSHCQGAGTLRRYACSRMSRVVDDPEGSSSSVVDAISDVPSVDVITGRSIRLMRSLDGSALDLSGSTIILLRSTGQR